MKYKRKFGQSHYNVVFEKVQELNKDRFSEFHKILADAHDDKYEFSMLDYIELYENFVLDCSYSGLRLY